MKLDLGKLLAKFVGLVKKSWNSFDVSTQRIVLGVLVILLGVSVPWSRFGEVGSYIQMGLVGGGLISAFYGYKKSEKGKDDDRSYCPECGREL